MGKNIFKDICCVGYVGRYVGSLTWSFELFDFFFAKFFIKLFVRETFYAKIYLFLSLSLYLLCSCIITASAVRR